MNSNEIEYFELKYLEEISKLFNKLKDIDNYYNLNLFKDNYCLFFEFIQKNVIINEFSDNESDTDDEENNLILN